MMTPEQLTGKATSHLIGTLVGNKSFLIHPSVVKDLLALTNAAALAGFNLHIASGFRDFERQSTIWNRKMSGESPILDHNSKPLDSSRLTDAEKVKAILRWSALPGASRHHWGCDFDLYDRDSLPDNTQLQLEPWEYLDGHQTSFYLWLNEHLAEFGFFFPYQQDLGGVACEPWHISHQKTANDALEQLTLDILRQELEASSIKGKQVVLAELESIYTQYITNIYREVT